METIHFPIPYFIILYILIALVAVCVCILANVIICCILILRWKKEILREHSINHEYHEVIDPIYEAVCTATVADSNHSGTQVRLENNDAYKNMKLKETSHASLGIDIENNEAYIHITSELNVLQMEHNKSYQVAPFNFNNPVIPEGLTTTYTQECYETQSVCNYENIPQTTSERANVLTFQNDQEVEFQNLEQPIPLCTESVDMNNSATNYYNSTELIFEHELQGVCKSELSCEKQSINSKDVESNTDDTVQQKTL